MLSKNSKVDEDSLDPDDGPEATLSDDRLPRSGPSSSDPEVRASSLDREAEATLMERGVVANDQYQPRASRSESKGTGAVSRQGSSASEQDPEADLRRRVSTVAEVNKVDRSSSTEEDGATNDHTATDSSDSKDQADVEDNLPTASTKNPAKSSILSQASLGLPPGPCQTARVNRPSGPRGGWPKSGRPGVTSEYAEGSRSDGEICVWGAQSDSRSSMLDSRMDSLDDYLPRPTRDNGPPGE